MALLEGIRTATGSPDPLSHFSPVACFAWCHFFDSLRPPAPCRGAFFIRMRRKGTVLRAAEKEAALEEKMDRWVYLNDLAERIAGQ